MLLLADLASVIGILTQTLNLYDDALRVTGAFCHRLPSRSPWVGGFPTALCYRCVGLYVGILIAEPLLRTNLVRRWFTPSWQAGLCLVAPTLLEVAAEQVFISPLWPMLREFLGLLVGIGIMVVLRALQPTTGS